jgi:FkbM family methyltransferase
MKRVLKSLIRKNFRKFGYKVEKLYPKSEDELWFHFHESCQIPNLSSIYLKIFQKGYLGTLVEVGAFDGEKFSNSSGLIQRGWSAILVEPIPKYAALCRERYRDYPNVQVVEKAASDRKGFEEILISGPLSTINTNVAREYSILDWAKSDLGNEKIVIETETLDSIAQDCKLKKDFDVLIIDVEGFEEEVFLGFDVLFWNPKVIIVELTEFHPTLSTERKTHFALGQKIISMEYTIIYKDSINTIFLKTSELRQIFAD